MTNPVPVTGVQPNCYNALTSLSGGGSSGGVANIANSKLFSMTCSYHVQGIPDSFVQQVLAGSITKFGCCFANQIALLVQNPIKTALVFPPCLLRYFSVNAKQIKPANFCTHKANGNMTVFEFNLNITSTLQNIPPPINVYDTTSILTFQAYMIKLLNFDSTVSSTLPPYTLNYQMPLQPELINYMYYNGNELLTPANGLTNTSDYGLSDKVALTYLLVFEGLKTQAEIDALSNWIKNPMFAQYFGFALSTITGHPYTVTVSTTQHTLATQFVAEPVVLPQSNSASSNWASSGVLAIIAAIGLYLTL